MDELLTTLSTEVRDTIRDNWQRCVDDVAAACEAAGRSAESVSIVGIAKYVDAAHTAALIDAGCPVIGENRPQALWQKYDQLGTTGCRWHLVGHLQRNKIRRTLPCIDLLHSADSRRLIDALNEEGERQQRRVPLLLEINISGDAEKTGLEEAEAEPLLEHLTGLEWVELRGLMAMAARDGGGRAAQNDFARLRKLRDRLHASFSGALDLKELSMGMSGDFREAIAEGATIVRIGSRLFEGILAR